ncbi:MULTISPECIES: phosphopantetheine-binding protein [unclassified Streptomyces]|uniref:phosphopantetheine-binding protein n=1 Tax=unclassified Streptomyces TaxID=2593676 RepID=UPI002257E208|nr:MULTISPECIES: phosphopantetheine-binding protein [unclassified Streptomyces]WSP53043.1 phosphopantetheine-binding protein [Streptomyces sp. NBC_01241]WSU19640.1 phosphopantetheine-binding protein [Streptomyces sp. NBC_01108]MCX4800052.1 phosphopantetheine-binding protein [Streptomyces sp. NBC_01242]WSJ40759.1 phosphopantetheine-binding protein [Streptomyces sp. NBC_01321]WSP59808.1 phosphopantetheine-binding protein [Streptomyces sp. NBC_01241]
MTTAPLTESKVLLAITGYVSRTFLEETEGSTELTAATPLLQLGILNSRNTGQLLAYIYEEFGVTVPPTRITGNHFADLDSISAMVVELHAG